MSDNSTSESEGRLAGIDYGTVRIGIAVTDRSRTIASPLETYQRIGEEADARFFQQLAIREEICAFVVGLPIHLSGDESQKSAEARRFGSWLAAMTNLPVAFFDERFTSREAEQALAQPGLSRKQRDTRRDMLAAQMMLTAYLESGQNDQMAPRALDA